MRKVKFGRISKGYILVETLLLGALIMSLSIYSFTIELRKTRNVISYKNYAAKTKEYEEHREYLLTKLSELYSTVYKGKTKDELKQSLIQSNLKLICEDGKGSLKYDKTSGYLCIDSIEGSYVYRTELYDFQINNDEISFSFEKSIDY